MNNILIFALDDLDFNRPKEFSAPYGFPTTGLHIATCFSAWGATKGLHTKLFFVDHEISKLLGEPKKQTEVLVACQTVVKQSIQEFQPSLIAIAAPYTRLAIWAYNIARECKKHSQALIITGGAHASFVAKDLLTKPDCPYDAIVLGDGESKIKHIINNINEPESIFSFSGIATKQTPNVAFGGHSLPLSEIPFTDYSLLPKTVVSNAGIALMAGRGCCFKCNFCIESVYWRDSIGFYPPGRTKQELNILFTQFNNPAVGLGDSTINLKAPKFEEFCENTFGNGEFFGSDFFIFTYANFLDKKKCKIFYNHGGRSIWVGIESGSRKIQNSMGKFVDLNKIDNQLFLAKEAGLRIGAFFMFGYPGETKDTAQETINLITRLHNQHLLDYIDPAIFVPYPGLPMYRDPDRYGIKIHKSWYDWRNWNRYHTLPVYDFDSISRVEIHEFWKTAFNLKMEIDIREKQNRNKRF